MKLVNLFLHRLVRGRCNRFVSRKRLRQAVAAVIVPWAASGCTAPTETARQDPAEFESVALMALVANLLPQAHWIGGEDRFWMKQEAGDGARFVVVDAATGDREPAFDHAHLAASLAEAGLADADHGEPRLLTHAGNYQQETGR